MSKKILIIAGDPSGDTHGANLIHSLQQIFPQLEIYVLGGEKMQAEKINFLYNLVDLTVIGFFEVLKKIVDFWKVFNLVKLFLKKEKPDAIVLIDAPGFNLRVANVAKKMGIPVVYYVSPQVWAWGKNRIKKISRLVKKMLVFFSFEERMYKQEKIDVSFVGHPMLDAINPDKNKNQTCSLLGLKEENPIIGIMPGSRKQEIDYLLPEMLKISKAIISRIPQAQFVFPLSENISMDYIKPFKIPEDKFQIVRDKDYNVRKIMDLALVASGTATLENACLGVPMIIMYRVSRVSYFLAKRLIKVPFIGLVNIIAGEKIVPEFIQDEIKSEDIAQKALTWLKSPQTLLEIKEKLHIVKEKLGKPGASRKAAEEIRRLLVHTGE
ncbi:lipid-A-disaccharide synthase [bacterium]|nr:lipid-A-disaccharide synthase [bacterium]